MGEVKKIFFVLLSSLTYSNTTIVLLFIIKVNVHHWNEHRTVPIRCKLILCSTLNLPRAFSRAANFTVSSPWHYTTVKCTFSAPRGKSFAAAPYSRKYCIRVHSDTIWPYGFSIHLWVFPFIWMGAVRFGCSRASHRGCLPKKCSDLQQRRWARCNFG